MNETWWQRFFPDLKERYTDLKNHFNHLKKCFNINAAADQAVCIMLEQYNNPDHFQMFQTMLYKLQAFSEVLQKQVDCLIDFKTKELHEHQRKAHYGGEEHKATESFIDTYTSTSKYCFEILQDIQLIKRQIDGDQRFNQLYSDVKNSAEKITKHSLYARVHPNLVVKQQVWITVSICLMLSKSYFNELMKTCKTLTCKIIRKDSFKEHHIDVVAGQLTGKEVVEIDLINEPDKDFFSGKLETKIKVVEPNKKPNKIKNPETSDYKYGYQLIFRPLFDVFGFFIDPLLSWPFMVHTGNVQDEKLTFYQFWSMAFYSREAIPSWSQFAQALQLIFNWITESTRALSEDQLKHIGEQFFKESPNRPINWEEIYKKPLGNGIKCSLWTYFYAACDFLSEKTKNHKRVIECYEQGVLVGFVDTVLFQQLLALEKEKPILGLRWSNSVPGGICAIVCYENNKIEQFEPFLHRTEINEYKSLADSILECDKLFHVKFLYKQINENGRRCSKVIGNLEFFMQYSKARESKVTAGYTLRNNLRLFANNQLKRWTVPKDQCHCNLSNQPAGQTNNTWTSGVSTMQNGLIDSRLQVSNVQASQSVFACDSATKQHKSNSPELKRKRCSNDQPRDCCDDTYSQNREAYLQPSSLQNPAAATAMLHHGQPNTNTEILEVTNRIGHMDFMSNQQHYEPPNSYNNSSCSNSNYPQPLLSTFMQNSYMNIVSYQQQLAQPAEQNSNIGIGIFQQRLPYIPVLNREFDAEPYQQSNNGQQNQSKSHQPRATAMLHHGQSNTNTEISEVTNRIGHMDFMSNQQHYEPPNSYNNSSGTNSNCPQPFLSMSTENSNMDCGIYQCPLTYQTSQNSRMNIAAYQQQQTHPAQQAHPAQQNLNVGIGIFQQRLPYTPSQNRDLDAEPYQQNNNNQQNQLTIQPQQAMHQTNFRLQ